MRVIILGAGQVGQSIARYLATDENEITVIDSSSEILQRISDKLDIKPVQGFASHPEVLHRAQAKNADLLIAVTASDEVNMVACEIAHSLFKVKTKIARIRHQEYLKNTDLSHFHHHMAIDVIISPELEVAKSLARSSQVAGAFEVFPFFSDDIKVIAVHMNTKSTLLHIPIRFLETQFLDLSVYIACICRQSQIFFPSPDDVIMQGDDVYFAVHSKDVANVMELFGFPQDTQRHLIIVGGGNIGLHLAQQIEALCLNTKLKLIEKNAAQCTEAARVLRTIDILNGDALDLDILAEANVQEAETILALTDDDKVNILVSLLAKQQGAKRSVSLLKKTSYSALVTSLGVDAVINPRVITVSSILQYVCQGRIRAIYSIADGKVEIIEAQAHETSMLVGLTVEDVSIRNTLQVIAILRDKKVFLNPKGILLIANDILIIIVHKDAARKAEKLFHERPVYL